MGQQIVPRQRGEGRGGKVFEVKKRGWDDGEEGNGCERIEDHHDDADA